MSGPRLRSGASRAVTGLGVTTGVVALAAVVVGCGSSSHTSAATSPSSAVAPVAPTTAATTSTTAPRGPVRCEAGGLKLSLADSGDGAAATRYLTIHATNAGGAPCTIGGYFGVASYDLGGKAIEQRDAHAPGTPVRQLTVPPGGVVTFVAGINDLPTGPEGQCPRLGSFHLVPPGATASMTLPMKSAGVVECAGVISVRPVAPA